MTSSNSNKNLIFKENGFTSIEIIIVMAVLVAMLAFGTIKVNYDSIILKSQANKFLSALRYTQQLNHSGDYMKHLTVYSQNGVVFYQVGDIHTRAEILLNEKFHPIVIVNKNYQNISDEDSSVDIGIKEPVNPNINRIVFQIKFTAQACSGDYSIIFDAKNSKSFYKITIIPTSGRIFMYEIDKI